MFSDILKPETFGFFARFLLAGFVFIAARSRFVVGERAVPSETIIEAVILSLINQAAYQMLASSGIGLPSVTEVGQAAFYFEVIALPAILGALSGWLVGRNWIPAGLRRLVLPVTRPAPDAYQEAFSQIQEPCFVIVSYADGRELLGYFGERSFAGERVVGGGILIEAIYVMNADGEWTEPEPARSAWISLEGVRSIEFLERQE